MSVISRATTHSAPALGSWRSPAPEWTATTAFFGSTETHTDSTSYRWLLYHLSHVRARHLGDLSLLGGAVQPRAFVHVRRRIVVRIRDLSSLYFVGGYAAQCQHKTQVGREKSRRRTRWRKTSAVYAVSDARFTSYYRRDTTASALTPTTNRSPAAT